MSFIYIFLFTIIVIFSILEFFNEKELGGNLFFSIIVIMVFIAGTSYAMSPDWIAYYKIFNYLDDVEWSEIAEWSDMSGMEAGYLKLNKFLVSTGAGFGMLTLIIVSISLYLKSVTFFKYGGLPFLVLFIYSMPNFMFEEHIHIRQALANGFGIYSVRYIIDRKLLKFLLCITIGYQFHESIVVFLLAYWIAPLKFDEKIIGWLVVFSIVGFYTGLNSVIELIMKFMPIGQEKFEDYQNELYNSEGGFAVGDFVKIVSVISIIVYNKYAAHDKIYCYFRNLFVFGVLLFFFLGKGIFGVRLPGSYLVFLGLTVGRLLYSFDGDKFKRVFVYSSFTLYTVILIFWFQLKQGSNSGFSNYRSFVFSESIYGLWKSN